MKNLKIFTENIESKALDEINNLLDQQAFADCKVRIMPDVHAGMGCVIGFTADLGDKVIPNVVGVDIGCGMFVVELGKIEINLEYLDNLIKSYVPCGFNTHDPNKCPEGTKKYVEEHFINKLYCKDQLKEKGRLICSAGTLGGGNHFIELDIDEEGNKYLVIHTGSRNLGKQVCDYYQNKAIEICSGKNNLREEQELLIRNLKIEGRYDEIGTELSKFTEEYKKRQPSVPKDLCYLEGKDREDYLHDMKICQEFAEFNRNCIAATICTGLGDTFTNFPRFHTIHNYISFKDNIVRKGAISARAGERLIIPINMRDGCIIGFGKGNEDWNYSAPHGAGRIMSRSKAKENINLGEFKNSMDGIYTTTVGLETLDEAPMVYKPMQEIIDNIGDTVEIERIIKPIYNFKSAE